MSGLMQAPSLEEVLRQHREAQQRRPREQDAALRRIKADHLKSRGNEAIKQGNYREAWERYSEALELQPDKAALPALHSNRSMAYCKAGRYSDALADAEVAANLAPRWHKAQWRRAAALLALKRVPEAVLAYRDAWRLASSSSSSSCAADKICVSKGTEDSAACGVRLWVAVQRLTREQLARGLLGVLGEMQAGGQLEPPGEEEASEQEQAEAMFRSIKVAHQGRPKPGRYYRKYLRWLQEGVQPGEAYTERAAMHAGAKCYLQARADAQAAVEVLRTALRDHEQVSQGGGSGSGSSGSGSGSGMTELQLRAAGAAGEARQQGQKRKQSQASATDVPGEVDDEDQGWPAGDLRGQMALAYRRLGEACLAEEGHVDRDCRGAAKAFLRAVELGSKAGAVQEGLSEAGKELTLEQMNQVEMEVYNEGPADGCGGASQAGQDDSSSGPAVAPGQRIFRVVLRLAFPIARAADCSSRAREMLRGGVAAAVGLDSLAVSIERVAAPTAARPYLGIVMHAKVGTDLLKASRLAKAVGGDGPSRQAQQEGQQADQQQGQQQGQQQQAAAGDAGAAQACCGAAQAQQGPPTDQPAQQQSGVHAHQERLQPPTPPSPQQHSCQPLEQAELETRQLQLAAVLGGSALTDLLGQPDVSQCSAEIEDVTPGCRDGASEAEQAQQDAINRGDVGVAAEKDRRLAVPARPKMEIELPYRMYRLVRADGSLVERVDKHPFCMSRVYYDATEKPEEVWTELVEGSCRWRQTGGEVKVLALRVPRELPSKQLDVDIQPYSLKVWNRATGEVYLQGDLERGVVPEECFWTHCGGEGEDGCAIYLRKMNLELLQKHWMHSEMWWPRLFKQHGNIAWDDYEKDYSDLPEEVLQRHRVFEAIKDDESRMETLEREHRQALQERDDLRKRTRQERLNELRMGTKQSWVMLNRALPAA